MTFDSTDATYRKFIRTLEARGDFFNDREHYELVTLKGMLYQLAHDVPGVTEYLKREEELMAELNRMEVGTS